MAKSTPEPLNVNTAPKSVGEQKIGLALAPTTMPCIAASKIAMSGRKSRNEGARINKKAKGQVRKASAKTDALTEILDK